MPEHTREVDFDPCGLERFAVRPRFSARQFPSDRRLGERREAAVHRDGSYFVGHVYTAITS